MNVQRTPSSAGKRDKARPPLPVVILVLAAVLGASGEEVLTLESAVGLALSRNERALQADQRVRAAESLVGQARAYFLPALTGTGTYTRRPFEVSRTVGGTNIVIQKLDAISGVAALNLTIFDARSLPALLQARSNRTAEQYAAAESKRQLAFEVGNAYLTTLGVDQVLEASRHRYDYARQALEAARARYAAGLVSVNDVTRAELEYATAEMGITQVQGQVETTYLQLGYLLDETNLSGRRLEVPEFLLRDAEAERGAVADLIAQAQDRRLDLTALRWRAKAQQALALQPLLKWLPSLSFGGQYRYTNEAGLTGRSTNWNAGLILTWSLFDGFARNSEYAERKANATLADLEVQSTLRKVELDVRDAVVSLANQRASLKQATVAHAVAKRNAAETAELYRQGLSTALQVADANVRLFEAEVTLVRERYGLGISYLNLEAALGLDPFGKEPKL
jgi:outer membrane protein TolC